MLGRLVFWTGRRKLMRRMKKIRAGSDANPGVGAADARPHQPRARQVLGAARDRG